MKFFFKRNLRTQAAYILAILLVLLVLQFLILRWKIQSIETLHYQETFAAKAQIVCQQIFMNTNMFLQGHTELSSSLIADLEMHDYMLKVLGEGGRIPGTAVFLEPLPRIPAISYTELQKHWKEFRKNVVANVRQNESIEANADKTLPGRWLTVSSWYERLTNDLDKELASARTGYSIWMIVCVGGDVTLLGLLFMLFIRRVIAPVNVINKNTSRFIQTTEIPQNEMGDTAIHINEVIEQLKDASEFVQQIGQGKLDVKYEDLDTHYEPGKNTLADALIDMQQKLKDVNAEEDKRRWVNEGLSKFVDILRTSNNNIKVLGDRVIATLVEYMHANQGGLYLLNDDNETDIHLELIAMFAFDIKKYEQQRIKPGEGILGQTFLEKKTTYLTRVPAEYMRITSGLGGDTPKAVLIVPLRIDQEVYGVVELASFEPFQEHEISFVERLGETIASTLGNVKANQRTQRLLEESKIAAENQRSQEEEMRQNMEELAATQEEMSRKEKEYITRINTLEDQLKSAASTEEVENARAALEKLTEESRVRIADLESQLADRPMASNDWSVVEEVEKTLRVNLEALRITRDQLGNDGI